MKYKHRGLTFKVVWIDSCFSRYRRLEELKYWCKRFHQYNLTPPYKGGSYGNLSFRIRKWSNQFIITGSRVGLKGDLDDECFVKVESVDLKNNIVYVSGLREPSSETRLHYAIYEARKDVNAIFHGHSREILAKADMMKWPITRKERPYGSIGLVKEVLGIISDFNTDFIIMRNHGFIALGKDMRSAGNITIYNYRACLK